MIIVILFFIVATLYSSVGHGGASGFIALMVLFSFPTEEIRSNALFLNLIVSLISFVLFFSKNNFPKKLFLLLSLSSVPMAYLGGMWKLHSQLFNILLGCILLIPIANFLGVIPKLQLQIKQNTLLICSVGILIGILSGILGIGGGIILSPLLLLFGWCTVKETPAVSALFIFVNSAAGLLGLFPQNLHISTSYIVPFITSVIIGGLLGGYLGAFQLRNEWIKYLLAFVLFIACIKLFIT
ncbi:MAG: TSUP family transporter [Candidatus Kapabacteria bacterium]|nr:TSUP family transporter [Candidatus Kapabacteria bacterium]